MPTGTLVGTVVSEVSVTPIQITEVGTVRNERQGTNFIVRDPPMKFLFLIIKNLFLELDSPKSLDLDPESVNLDPQH
jgi:hypothetical protein